MRLIDADAFIEYLGLDAENSREDNLGEIVTLEDFDSQPTVYDVDKVVEQIRKFEICGKCLNNHNSVEVCAEFCDAGKKLKIIKSGGIE